MSKSVKIFWAVAGIVLVAGLGSIFVNIGIGWFGNLNKPSQFVPNWAIPVIWTIIYILAGVVLINLIKNEKFSRNLRILFIINGTLNVLWCLVFFALKQTQLGNIIIVINAYFACYLIYALQKTNKLYAAILTIYPIWVCIASTLNTCLWILNWPNKRFARKHCQICWQIFY